MKRWGKIWRTIRCLPRYRYLLVRLKIAFGVVFALSPSVAFAHDGTTLLQVGAFLTGFVHPVLGIDHFLAMLSVGIVSAQGSSPPKPQEQEYNTALKPQTQVIRSALVPQTQLTSGRAIWIVPATFVIVMALGALIGFTVPPNWSIELGIAFSVVSLGVLIAADRKFPMIFILFVVAFFALFHGIAHGVEMPQMVDTLWYAGGFLSCTALIHLAGVLVGFVPQRFAFGRHVLRFAGGAVALCGVVFI